MRQETRDIVVGLRRTWTTAGTECPCTALYYFACSGFLCGFFIGSHHILQPFMCHTRQLTSIYDVEHQIEATHISSEVTWLQHSLALSFLRVYIPGGLNVFQYCIDFPKIYYHDLIQCLHCNLSFSVLRRWRSPLTRTNTTVWRTDCNFTLDYTEYISGLKSCASVAHLTRVLNVIFFIW